MAILYIITGSAISVSFIINRKKTFKALKIAFKKFIEIIPSFISMLILISIILFFVPDTVISKYLSGNNMLLSVFFASVFGSITLMPGFIVFPLCGILLQKGVSYMVLSAFTTTLMMVGVITFPIERRYFGTKITIIRNIISLGIAIIVALITGIIFGEVL